jgi:nicotinate-nucleotide adenylyltransferase
MINGIRRIGIYGGTFSPPHKGHVEAARAFISQMRLDYLYVIPAAIPPHKTLDHTVEARHRLKMCELAFAGIEGIIVSDVELKRGGVSYTVDTLRELCAPDARLFLLCGTDMLLTLDKWREAEEIFRLCYPIYIRRENDPIMSARILSKINEYTEKYNAVIRRVVTDPLEISSTDIRRRIAAEEEVGDLVPAAVEEYIRENRLYGVK